MPSQGRCPNGGSIRLGYCLLEHEDHGKATPPPCSLVRAVRSREIQGGKKQQRSLTASFGGPLERASMALTVPSSAFAALPGPFWPGIRSFCTASAAAKPLLEAAFVLAAEFESALPWSPGRNFPLASFHL